MLSSSGDVAAFSVRNIRMILSGLGRLPLREPSRSKNPGQSNCAWSHFYPKPRTFVSISKEESKEVNLNFINALPYKDQQTFLKLWMKVKKGIPAFSTLNKAVDGSTQDDPIINSSPEDQLINP